MSIVSINYKLKTEPKSSLKQYDNIESGVQFINRLDMDNVEYVSLTDGYGYQAVGKEKINKVYKKNNDLYGGQKYCLHPDTDSNPSGGGGSLCPECRAWFCY